MAQEPLCGIRSVYTAAILLGCDPIFSEILLPEFVGSERGSSLAELEKAAAKLGLHSAAVSKLSIHDLASSAWPVVLHVKTVLSSSEYDHFVLFAGYDGRRATIYDGPNGRQSWTLAEVASRWDGNALIMSNEPVRLSAIASGAWQRRVYWLVGVAGAAGLAVLLQRRAMRASHRRIACGLKQAVALCLVAGCGAWAYHATSPDGFIAGPEAVRAVRAANASRFLPTIDLATARSLHQSGRALFIDARGADDFNAGHIDGAVNFSAHTSHAEAARIAARLPRDRRIVVYCANPKCPYSFRVAQWLLEAGVEDVVIFPDGWKAWRMIDAEARAAEAPRGG